MNRSGGDAVLDVAAAGAISTSMNSFALAIAAAVLAGAFVTPAASAALDAFRWKARPIVMFIPQADDARAIDQISRLRKDRIALYDRVMPVFLVVGDRVTTLAGAPAPLKAAELRRSYGVERDAFAMILVGKDGGEKFRTGEPVAAGRLISLVDDMPMRKNEAR